MQVTVFGSGGLLGRALCKHLEAADHQVHRFVRTAQQPCRNEAEIAQCFAETLRVAPDCVINLIADTSVDHCNQEMGNAALLNCFVPQALAHLCRGRSHLIHISSDQVYSGIGPHRETLTHPINTYALTKLVGEYPVLQNGGCVLRTNFFGKSLTPGRHSFSDWLIQAGRSGMPLNVFDDVYFSPLGISSLCNAIFRAMDCQLSGLYNLGAVNGISKANFAYRLFEQMHLDQALLNPISVATARLTAPRPNDMRMDSSKFAEAANFSLPTIEKEIIHEASNYR